MKMLLHQLRRTSSAVTLNARKNILVASFLLLASLAANSQTFPVVSARFANPQYDCSSQTYHVDVEFQSNQPLRRLAGMNIRFVYDSQVLQYLNAGEFATGYNFSQTPKITTGNQSSGPGYFLFEGPMTYWNGAVQLQNPYATPVYLATNGWTKLFSLAFLVINADDFDDNQFSPSLVWEKHENRAEGGFFGGSDGVVITLVDIADPLKSEPSLVNVLQYNWTYNNDEFCISFGHPVVTDPFLLPASDCNGLDQVIHLSAEPFALGGALPDGGIYSGNGITGNYFFPAVAGIGIHPVKYVLIDENECPMICSFNIIVYDIPKISGQVTYFNDQQTPLNNVSVKLKDVNGNIVATTVSADYQMIAGDNGTVVPGFYFFPQVPDGTYTIIAGTEIPWLGANSTDALLVQLHIVGNVPANIIWDPVLSTGAADVNLSNTITSLDALQIMRRTVGAINSFPAGDWIFNNQTISVEGQTTVNLKALNTGDVNRSNIPFGMKSEPTIKLQYDGEMLVQKGQEVFLPVAINNLAELGAITLELDYRKDLIQVLETDFEINKINQNEGKLALAWSSTTPHSYLEGDIIVMIKARVLDYIPPQTRLFEIKNSSELADARASVLKNTVLQTPWLVSERNEIAELQLSNQPNPFNDFTRINYTLPQDGNVMLVVYDHSGRVIETLVNTFQTAGNYEVEFSHPNLKPGVYPYRIILDQGEKATAKSQTMIFISKE